MKRYALFQPMMGGIITAANIAISEEWINSSTYINTSKYSRDNDNALE